jgi:phage terminase small subunit
MRDEKSGKGQLVTLAAIFPPRAIRATKVLSEPEGAPSTLRVHTMKVLSSAKHEAVARALIADPKSVGWRAYKAVYPKSSRHAAETGYARLSKNADFTARIDELKAAAAEGAVATARQVLEELSRIGLANMADYIGPNFEMRKISDMSRNQTAAIAEVTVDVFVDGRGENAREVRRVKFKLADKRAALVDLGRHYKLFTDKHEHAGEDGGPLSQIVPVINLFGRPQLGDESANTAQRRGAARRLASSAPRPSRATSMLTTHSGSKTSGRGRSQADPFGKTASHRSCRGNAQNLGARKSD